jgi:hypothetical protein
LWAVLAGGDDAAAVHDVIEATSKVAEVQAGGGTGKAVATATQERRKALEHLVDRSVKALARWESGAETKRAEIRGIIDQVSRRADLAEAWIEGTLRELPGDTFGFAAFEERDLSALPERAVTPKTPKAPRTLPRAATGAAAPTEPKETDQQPTRTAEQRAERAQLARQARKAIRDAARDLAAAERKLESAQRAMDEAAENLRAAEEAHAEAQQRHESATAQLRAAEAE